MAEDPFEKKQKIDANTVEIKIRFNRFWLERVIYIIIILMLIVTIFYNPFGGSCEKNLSDISSTPAAEEPEIETEPSEAKPAETPKPEPVKPASESSGSIGFTLDSITLNTNNTKVESITVKIDNQKKIFTPTLKIFWYDDEDSAVAKMPKVSINYTGAIPMGTLKTWKLDKQLTARFLSFEEGTTEGFFRAELYDASDNSLISTQTKTVKI